MSLIARRTLLLGSAAILPVSAFLSPALAVDALPDARFVGYAQTTNDFEIGSGKLALAKSRNEDVRSFANRLVGEHVEAAELLRKARAEAGVTYAPDPSSSPRVAAILQRLGALEGPDFDLSYANAQLAVLTDAELQLGAYSQTGSDGALRRYAQHELTGMKVHLAHARRLAGDL